jgi:hypothetical protein
MVDFADKDPGSKTKDPFGSLLQMGWVSSLLGGQQAPAPHVASVNHGGVGGQTDAQLDGVYEHYTETHSAPGDKAVATANSDGETKTESKSGPQNKKNKKSTKSDRKQADAALKEAQALLDPAGKHDDPDKDAIKAVDTLTSLSAAQQRQAMQRMSSADFDRLLSRVPKDNREQLESLFKNCTDPEKKLRLWAEVHKSRVGNDAKEKNAVDTALHGVLGSDADLARRVQDRSDIATTTDQEVDEEVKHLLELKKSGRKLSAKDVEKLAQRKHLVNITNDVDNAGTPGSGAVKPTERVTWSKQELEQIASGLDRLPPGATAGNPLLKEIRRSKMRKDFDSGTSSWEDQPNVGGDHGGGVITVYDAGVHGNYRHTGQTSQLGDHHKGKKAPHGPISPLEETIVHEVGHDIADLNSASMDKLKATTGWGDVGDKAALKAKLMGAGLSDADAEARISELEGQRDTYGAPGITVGGVTYHVDPYSSGFISHNEGGVPAGEEWDYARMSYHEHYAELYAKAVHVPERLHRDLVEKPAKDVEAKDKSRRKLATRIEQLRKSGASPAQVAKVEEQLKHAEADLEKAKREKDMHEQQWQLMREDVFGVTDDAVDNSADSLMKDVPKAKRKKAQKLEKEFKQRAERVATPHQLEALEKEYQAKIAAL